MKSLPIFLLLGMLAFGQDKPTLKLGNNISESGATTFYFDMTPQPSIQLAGSQIIRVMDKDHKLMVNIAKDGKVTYGEGYDADSSAKQFWETLAKYYPSVCDIRVPAAKKSEKLTTGKLTDWEKKNCYIDTVGTPNPGGDGNEEISGMACPPAEEPAKTK